MSENQMANGCKQEFNATPLEVEYIHNTKNMELFKRAYEKLFATTWPEYVDLDRVEDMCTSTNPNIEKFLMVVGKNLSDPDPDKRDIIGFRYAFYFPQSQTGLLVYLVVDEKARGQRIGHQMVELTNQGLAEMAEARGQSLKGVYFEIDDPAKMERCSGGLSPSRRKALFESWGGKQVDIDYIRPDYNDDGTWQMDQKYLLMSYPYKGKHPTPQSTENYLVDVLSFLTEEKDFNVIRNFPETKTMAGQLHNSGQKNDHLPHNTYDGQ